MHAAIWLSDLRGFTPLSDRLAPQAIVNLLNTYFDCQVAPILKHGGEVLKFMGDGLLAIFPIAENEGDAATVCSRVLEAARECRANVEAMRYENGSEILDGFRFGLALHTGQVLYGNIGGGDRLDFTCIGPAVNLAARIEKDCQPAQSHRPGVNGFRTPYGMRVDRSRAVFSRGIFGR